MTSVSLEPTAKHANLVFTTGSHRVGYYSLGEGESLIVGSGGNCGVKLDDPAVSSIHCILRLSDGQLFAQDWCSTLGTLVNGVRIDEDTVVADGSSIHIGRFEISVELENMVGGARIRTETDCVNEKPNGAVEGRSANTDETDVPDESSVDAEIPVSPPSSRVEEDESGSLNGDVCGLHSGGDDRADDHSSFESQHQARPRKLLLDGVDPEAVSLLQAEIECLQSDLLERDRQLAELQSLVDDQVNETPVLESSETEALVGRLEQLLEELESSDQRVRVLEELLQAEQEVTRAQNDERTQVEAWLGDIERRISMREDEWHAERTALLCRVEQIKAERDEADRQIQAAESDPDSVALQQNIVKKLRSRIDELQDELGAAEQHRQTIEKELSELKSKSPEEARQEFLEAALREDRLKLAQEQAALSRERSQIARRLAEAEAGSAGNRHNEADERFRAFRQTLKELHDKDQVRSPGARKASLGTRIADLWRRLDGPTDTD